MRCNLCPRACRVDRAALPGACGAGALPRVARVMTHMWEEPCISGTRGSGAIFFSGCNLRCIFCQNVALQDGVLGELCTSEQLAELFLKLQACNVHNINLVTPTPHIPVIRRALLLAKANGLTLPVVYNTGSYERVSSLRALEGLIDVYLPDMKYVSPILSERFSGVADYYDVASAAIAEMFRQVGPLIMDGDGIAMRGVLVRHLVLPGCLDDSRRVLDDLVTRYTPAVYLSLMRQYVPAGRVTEPPLNRKLTSREYDRIMSYAIALGMNHIWIQEKEAANPDFTPSFTDSQ